MKTEIAILHNNKILDREQARAILNRMLIGDLNPSSIASFLTVYNMRQPTVEELHGFVEAIMESCIRIDLDAENAIDIVGTGGDGKNTFNISTLSSIVVAAAGIRVIKHGNYGSSSISGSSDVLEKLGYRFTNDESTLRRQLEAVNICFLHAPLFHPLMSKLKQVRKELNLQTVFNLLGPLTNPASPGKQMLGVSHQAHIRRYKYLLDETDKVYSIIHSMDGYDEISLTGGFKVTRKHETNLFYPEDIGMQKIAAQSIVAGDSVSDAVEIFLNILQGKGTSQQEMVVVANSAFAIQCVHPERDIALCIEIAKTALSSGKAYQVLNKIIELS